METISTNKLQDSPADGTVVVGFDEQDFAYWGMTEQGNGDMLVHLDYLDGTSSRHDIEVAAQDRDEPYWDL